ncbi:TPA_asm: hypothetical protein GIH59_12630 [Listeria monocytogenes]|nr:hypothetical protein [Listeria monocytogenes]
MKKKELYEKVAMTEWLDFQMLVEIVHYHTKIPFVELEASTYGELQALLPLDKWALVEYIHDYYYIQKKKQVTYLSLWMTSMEALEAEEAAILARR